MTVTVTIAVAVAVAGRLRCDDGRMRHYINEHADEGCMDSLHWLHPLFKYGSMNSLVSAEKKLVSLTSALSVD